MTLTINQSRDFSTLFSRSEICRWQKEDFERINNKLKRYDLYKKHQGESYLSFLRKTYRALQNQYPNEYVIKNELLNKWVKKELGEKNASIFNELSIGKARADLVMFNGVSKVFEIKTIFDDDTRLLHQLEQYKRIFNEVYIVVPKKYLDKYLDVDKNVGVVSYNSNSKTFSLKRESKQAFDIDVGVLMEVLHTKEYLGICKATYSELPEMNAFNQFEICKELIAKIPKYQLNTLFLDVMKQRGINNEFFNIVNNEFNQICLSLNLTRTERNKLIEVLRKKII